MYKTFVGALILAMLVACSSQPNLYSPVLPMEDGSLFTSTTASSKDKALVRATRNAERYCAHQNKTYSIVTMKSIYEGVLESEEAANKVEKSMAIASKITMGIITPGTDTDYRMELAFRCNG
jgi:hypothetical protein